jgi:hypothetical protein
MARIRPERQTPLTLEQVRDAHRAIRRAMCIAVAHACFIVFLVAVWRPHYLLLAAAIVVLYTSSIPILLRRAKRDIDRRAGASDDTVGESFGGRR